MRNPFDMACVAAAGAADALFLFFLFLLQQLHSTVLRTAFSSLHIVCISFCIRISAI